jgi:hypothetical protein
MKYFFEVMGFISLLAHHIVNWQDIKEDKDATQFSS